MPNKNTGAKIKIVPNSIPEIGIDTQNTIMDEIIGAAQVGGLDVASIESLTQSAQNREQTYELIDEMAQDSRIAAVLETYASDIVQPNDRGRIVWAEADDSKIANYTNWLIDTLNVDKHIYRWAYCLVTYGDLYLRLYRQSDVEDDMLFKKSPNERKINEDFSENKEMNESVKIRLYSENDKYIPYVKMVDNPSEMFDLQKFGKTHGFVKAPVGVVHQTTDELYSYLTHYKMNQSDVEVFDALSFVHACMDSTNQRQPETVDIFLDGYKQDQLQAKFGDDAEYAAQDVLTSSYEVKRGQSILYNVFRSWRELSLLEMSAMLNRLTRSAIVRILNIDVGDMPKPQIETYLSKLKEKIEQKSALNAGKSFSEYNMSGPIDNTIYVPTHEGKGAINATTIGGDFDPKSLVDLEYWKNMIYGALRVPKQYFSEVEDGAGFNGGSALTIISARYGNEVRKFQTILCQLISDLVNLFLIDRGLDNYVNKFTIRMQPPVTQTELDRRANNDTRIRYITDIMSQLDGVVDDPMTKLRVYRAMISQVINDPDVVNILQTYIDKLERDAEVAAEGKETADTAEEAPADEGDVGFEDSGEEEELPTLADASASEVNASYEPEVKDTINEDVVNEQVIDEHLPSPEDLNMLF